MLDVDLIGGWKDLPGFSLTPKTAEKFSTPAGLARNRLVTAKGSLLDKSRSWLTHIPLLDTDSPLALTQQKTRNKSGFLLQRLSYGHANSSPESGRHTERISVLTSAEMIQVLVRHTESLSTRLSARWNPVAHRGAF